MLLSGKEKIRIDSRNVTLLNAISTSLLNYLLFFVLLFFIASQLYRDSAQNIEILDQLTIDTNQTEQNGVECAYKYSIDKRNLVAWQEFDVFIRYNPDKDCLNKANQFLTEDGDTVIRLQVYGTYEMTSTTAKYVGNKTYIATLRLTVSTKYIVMVFLTYVNRLALEQKQNMRPLLRHIPGSPFEIDIKKPPRKNHQMSVPQYSRYCTKNESGISSGRWLKCGTILPDLERCGLWQSPEFDFDHIHHFRWLPYDCQYHTYTDDEVKRCFASNAWNSIVFAGDSHMRYRAYHWATRLYGGCTSCVKTHIKMVFDKIPRIEWVFDARGTRLPLSFENITLPNEIYIHPKVRRSKFSVPFPADAMKSNLFLLNFGHWILRESVDIDFMTLKLNAYAKASQMLVNQGKTVLWVNTVSLPWRTDQAVRRWRENTSPFRVRQFNQLADKVIKQYGIPMVNAYDISDSRIAATHDQTHYTKRLAGNDFGGVVENAITNAIFNKLCNE